MIPAGIVTAEQERPVFFTNGRDSLFGVVTTPATPARGVGVVTLSGGVHVPSANRNRLWTVLCRRLGAAGFHTLRFDYYGTGESGGPTEPYRREEPRTADLLGAVGCLRKEGVDRFVLVGTCFGSFTAILTAPAIESLDAVVLLSPLILDSKSSAERASRESTAGFLAKAFRPGVLRALLSPAKRAAYGRLARAKTEMIRSRSHPGTALPASPRILAALAELARRKVPILVVFGSGDDHYEDWKRASEGRLGKLLSQARQVEVRVLPGYLHGFPQVALQEQAIEVATSWLTRVGGPGAPDPSQDLPAATMSS